MMNIVKINDADVRVVEYQGQRVINADTLAKFYGVSANNIHDNHRNNPGRFEDGVHFFKLEGEQLRQFKLAQTGNGPVSRARSIVLWTERGAMRHAKMLESNAAWSVFEQLESNYFKPAQPRIAYTTMPQDTLTASEADQLRDMMREGLKHLPASQQGAAMTQGWSKLKAHFKVKYREIPRHEFPEALSLLSRHLAAWTQPAQALPAPHTEPLQRALDSVHLMAASMADLSSAVFHLVERHKGEGLNGGNRQPLGETYAAATAKASVIAPL